jgi:hypothetical protein
MIEAKRVLAVTSALLASVAIVQATSGASTSGWTVERNYTCETWSSFADIGQKDNGGPGDVYTSQRSLKDARGMDVGVVNGFGVNLHKPYVFFHWTASLRDGTLTIESAIDLMRKTETYPIAGGTGRYTGVRGTVRLSDVGGDRSLVVVRYRR